MSVRVGPGRDYIGVGVTFLCHDGHGNVLLSLRGQNARDEQGVWDVGGGAVEFGEKQEETVRNEVQQEYCASPREIVPIGVREVFREQEGVRTHWIMFDFCVRLNPGEGHNGEPHKLDDVRWFPFSAMPTPMHSQYATYLGVYKDRISRYITSG